MSMIHDKPDNDVRYDENHRDWEYIFPDDENCDKEKVGHGCDKDNDNGVEEDTLIWYPEDMPPSQRF